MMPTRERGHGPHRYVFQLFAPSRILPALDLQALPSLAAALPGRVLDHAVLTGVFQRD